MSSHSWTEPLSLDALTPTTGAFTFTWHGKECPGSTELQCKVTCLDHSPSFFGQFSFMSVCVCVCACVCVSALSVQHCEGAVQLAVSGHEHCVTTTHKWWVMFRHKHEVMLKTQA